MSQGKQKVESIKPDSSHGSSHYFTYHGKHSQQEQLAQRRKKRKISSHSKYDL